MGETPHEKRGSKRPAKENGGQKPRNIGAFEPNTIPMPKEDYHSQPNAGAEIEQASKEERLNVSDYGLRSRSGKAEKNGGR